MTQLRPGLHVVRRDDRHLQIGLDPPWRLVVPDEPDVQRVLADLTTGRSPAPATPAGHRVLRDLAGAGMLEVVRRRSTGRVLVLGAPALRAEVARVLASSPVRVVEQRAQADLVLLLSAGEPARATVDEQLREGRPHLVVGAGPRAWRVGPFVVPGQTACLRCVDAHLGEHDPRRAVAVEQLAGRPARPEDDPLAALALAWAARDVLRYLTGDRPTTWSSTVDLGPELDPRPRPWGRHAWCGCAWDALATG